MNAVRVALATLSLALFLGATTRGDEPSAELIKKFEAIDTPDWSDKLKLGLEDRFRLGCWTPLRFSHHRLRLGQITAAVPDSDGVAVEVDLTQSAMAKLQDPPRETPHDCLVQVGRLDGSILISISGTGDKDSKHYRLNGARQSDTAPLGRAVPAESRWFVGLGAKQGWPAWNLARHSSAALTTTIVERFADLPTDYTGYDGVDHIVVVWTKALAADLEASCAIELVKWVRHGGRLTLLVDADAIDTLDEPIAKSFKELIPGTLSGSTPLPRFDALENSSGSSQRIVSTTSRHETGVRIARLESPRGRVEISEAGIPLVVRSAYGLGEVTFVATSFTQPTLAEWAGRQPFMDRLLGMGLATTTSANDDRLASRYGLTDLSGQLCAALDNVPQAGGVAFWHFVAWVAGLALLIGPADYWFVHRVLRRPALTWLTLPVVLVAATWCAAAINESDDSPAMIANQVDVIDSDASSKTQRSRSWLGLYSRRSQRMDISAAPESLGRSSLRYTRVGWFAAPGSGWTGMHSRTEGAVWPEVSYKSDGNRLEGVPFDAHSTRAFQAQWETIPADILANAQLRVGVDEVLNGSLTAQQQRLRRAVLLHDRWAWEIGDLAPGQTFTVPPAGHKDIGSTLRETRTISSAERGSHWQAALEYDVTSRELAPVMRAMMFHEAIGGRAYTGLPNVQQAWLDLSHLLKDRAILFAELDDEFSACDWQVSDSAHPDDKQTIKPARRVSFVRVVLPLEAPSPAPVGGAP